MRVFAIYSIFYARFQKLWRIYLQKILRQESGAYIQFSNVHVQYAAILSGYICVGYILTDFISSLAFRYDCTPDGKHCFQPCPTFMPFHPTCIRYLHAGSLLKPAAALFGCCNFSMLSAFIGSLINKDTSAKSVFWYGFLACCTQHNVDTKKSLTQSNSYGDIFYVTCLKVLYKQKENIKCLSQPFIFKVMPKR